MPSRTSSSHMSSSPSLVNLTPSVEESMDDFSSQAFFYLNYKDIEHTTSVSRDQVDSLDHHKAIFLTSLSNWTPETKSNVQFSLPESAVCLLAQFIQFLLERQVAKSAIRSLVRVFRRDFVVVTDIHSLVSTLPDSTAVQKSILRTYYTALSHCFLSSGSEQSALFREAEQGNASLLAVFGGQGAFNPRCFEELRDIYVTYSPFLEDLIESIDSVLSESCRLSETSDFYHGREISLRTWLDHPETVPNGDYLATAPVSFPIIGAISLAHFCVVCKVLEKSPGEIRSLLQGVTGHSQGIVVAAGIARSDSWSSFYENARSVTRMLFWLGYESHRAAPKCPLPASLVSGSEENEEGKPSPMLHIGGLQRSQIDDVVAKCNNELPPGQQLYLALSNTRDSYVVAGPARSLIGLNAHLRDLKASEGLDQSRIPFDRRKPIVKNQFLPISAPFHTPYLTEAARRIKERLSNEKFEATELKIPVYHSQDGSDMRTGVADVLSSLIDAVTTQHVDWPSTLRSAKSTHILAFGKGVGEIVSKNKEGKGVRVIFGTQLVPLKEGAGARPEIFAPQLPRDSMRTQSWEEQFAPQLFKSTAGQIGLKTKLSQLLGTPPIMIGGMTPTTVPWEFVSSIMNAGYHVELAGGGYYNSESMSAAIANVTAHVPPGRGITCNLIYASPHAMKWQIAMLRQLAQKGHPIDGLTIGAGVPNLEVAGEYINTLGLRHLSLKPGSEDAIMNVLELAKAYPSFPIILQWTGGRGGGHHSFEDFHVPILHLYGKIRQCSNVVLVAGSGFGDAVDSYPYLTGAWSTQFGYAKMPFDGILLGSRIMVAKEAHTSPQAKALICEAPGCQNSEWTMSYSKPTGGIVTVQSEMGQPIHKIATRAVLFWKEMDEQIFSLPRAKQLEAIEKRKDYIIRRLNADFSKPWFGRNSAGDVVDLSEMTYSEVLNRLISLMYVSHQKRWINRSYSALVHDFIIRTIERIPTNFEMATSMLSEPESLETKFCTACPQASFLKLHPEDVSWFVNRCRSRGQKPVNFVPVFDENFAVWFKKDSLWQSEDVDAVVDQDAGRVCILHSPVGASYSQRTDEPVKDILDGINNGLITMTQQEFYNDAEIPLDAPADTPFERSVSLDSVQFTESLGSKIFQLLPGEVIPSQSEWFEYLTSQTSGWMRAVFSSQDILRNNTRQPNFIRRIFQIGADNIMRIDFTQSTVSIIPTSNGSAPALIEMSSKNKSKIVIHVRHITPRDSVPVVLELEFRYNPDNSVCPLSEIMGRRNHQVQSFYSKLWLGTDLNIGHGLHSTFSGKSTVLTAEMLNDWMLSVGLSYSNDATLPHDTDIFPINACIVPAWESLMKPLLVRDIDGDILKLVHLSNSFQMLPGSTPLRIGDSIEVSSRIQAVTIEDSGKSIAICATIEREQQPVVSVTSTFLIQGSFSDFRSTFRRKNEADIIFDVVSHIEEALLRDREWLLLDKASLNLVGKRLLFRLYTYTTWKNRTTFKTLRTTGEVFIQDQNDSLTLIGEVMSESLNCRANLVLDFLSRKGQPAVQRHELEHPGWSGKSSMVVKMPLSSQNYGRVSKDYNPIHVSPIFATIANLSGPIVHGMYTSAVASSVLEHLLDDGDRLRARQYSVSFLAKVLPGEELNVKVQHVAMIQGRMIFKVEAFKLDSDEKVLAGEAEFEQLPTAYVFTGQGSQAPGMGMDLYKSSPVAKKIWDDTDAYLFENYGWSILQIVRENPKELTIHFGGKRGKKIREKYLAMKVDSTTPDGNTISRSVLQDLDSNTPSFTFTEARGLLYSTQFAQPAICLLEKATFEDIRAKGLVQEGALFAGHSLGEYGVLSALAEFMPFESMMDLVFYRGLAMQTAMARDEFGETGYSMVAVNPKRVGKGFGEGAIRRVTSMIADESKQLLEIVNFNVQGEQYVCAGHLRNIHALTLTLNALSQLSPTNLSSTLLDTNPTTASTPSLAQIITKSLHASSLLPEPITLTRGKASIPLTGIDVPFHSSLLRPGVGHYRRFLQDKIREQDVQVEKLEGRWMPNVMGSVFDVGSEFVKKVQERTGSEILRDVLAAEVLV